jgi:hypothetical protein
MSLKTKAKLQKSPVFYLQMKLLDFKIKKSSNKHLEDMGFIIILKK